MPVVTAVLVYEDAVCCSGSRCIMGIVSSEDKHVVTAINSRVKHPFTLEQSNTVRYIFFLVY